MLLDGVLKLQNGYIVEFILFFFQAEDGIRDIGVTGVQTCALPISWESASKTSMHGRTLRPRLSASNCPRKASAIAATCAWTTGIIASCYMPMGVMI